MTDFQLQEGGKIKRKIACLQERIEAFQLAKIEGVEKPASFTIEVKVQQNERMLNSTIHQRMDTDYISEELRDRCQEELYECSLRIVRLFEKEITKLHEQFNAL